MLFKNFIFKNMFNCFIFLTDKNKKRYASETSLNKVYLTFKTTIEIQKHRASLHPYPLRISMCRLFI